MKTKNLFQSILPALIVVVLIVSIVTATVLLSRSGLPDVKGEVNADELFGNGKVFYSLETVQQFDIYIERFIKNLLNSFDDFDVASLLPELSVGALGEQLRLPFKNAGIASDKVLAFGRYLSEIDPQFSLTADGLVGKATWYKVSFIYVSVKDLAELTSEGEAAEGTQSAGAWPGTSTTC